MKANELRIGNYYNQFTYIHQVNGDIISELEKAPQGQLWCKPIPLTEEWLLRMGFEKSDNYGNDEYRLDGYSYFRGSFYISDCDECGESVEINFVHELQNLYFALTKKELTMK
jgi:hypothetical protein